MKFAITRAINKKKNKKLKDAGKKKSKRRK